MQYDTIQQAAAYTGLKQSCFVSTVNVVRTDNGKTVDSQVKPEVFDRQDGKNVVPVQPGSYDVWFKVDGNQYDVIEEKLVYGEADMVVSGLKRGGSYQFKVKCYTNVVTVVANQCHSVKHHFSGFLS